jgi:hypothetical protein
MSHAMELSWRAPSPALPMRRCGTPRADERQHRRPGHRRRAGSARSGAVDEDQRHRLQVLVSTAVVGRTRRRSTHRFGPSLRNDDGRDDMTAAPRIGRLVGQEPEQGFGAARWIFG